jgi:RimJ/RimL family protein N-acetyltransferase
LQNEGATGVTLRAGRSLASGDVWIGPPVPEDIARAAKAADVAESVQHWLRAALERDDVYYFAIQWRDHLVGQILLHDIDRPSRESLVAYHPFEPSHRGNGIGTTALRLLQEFVVAESDLARLVIITSDDNVASQRVALKCGFAYTGASREDPVHGMVFAWQCCFGETRGIVR